MNGRNTAADPAAPVIFAFKWIIEGPNDYAPGNEFARDWIVRRDPRRTPCPDSAIVATEEDARAIVKALNDNRWPDPDTPNRKE